MKSTINLLSKRAGSLGRKLAVMLTAAAFVALSAFATGDESNTRAVNNLKKQYSTAKNIEWRVTSEYTKASFTWNNQHLEVFYNKDGETIAESKLININGLPVKAQQTLNKRYSDYTVTDAIEYTSEQTGLCYFVGIMKGAKKQILKISPEGQLSLFNK